MHQHYTVHFAKGALPPRIAAECYFLDPELGHRKGRGSVFGGSWQRGGVAKGDGQAEEDPQAPREKPPALTIEASAHGAVRDSGRPTWPALLPQRGENFLPESLGLGGLPPTCGEPCGGREGSEGKP